MQRLIYKIEQLKTSDVAALVKTRIHDFKNINTHSSSILFKELCFCILAANFNSLRTIEIIEKIQEYLQTSSTEELSQHLKNMGYRFPNIRACYIVNAQHHCESLPVIVNSLGNEELRRWFVQNIKGLGYKEASHFLRNIGFDGYAIIDFHIVDLLTRYTVIDKPQTLTPRRYLEIEQVLRGISEKTSLSLAELDLYLWYIETGKILK